MTFLKPYEILFKKAETDLHGAEVLYKSDNEFLDVEIVFFHLQQSIEKFLKAILSYRGIHYTKTHDLEQLFKLLGTEFVLDSSDVDFIEELNMYAVQGRYDYVSGALDNIDDFFKIAKKIRKRAYEIIKIN
jgi:HEPN domain-containing protein